MKEKKTDKITIRIEEELSARILEQAESEHRDKSDFVRHAVITYLDKIDEVKKMTGSKKAGA